MCERSISSASRSPVIPLVPFGLGYSSTSAGRCFYFVAASPSVWRYTAKWIFFLLFYSLLFAVAHRSRLALFLIYFPLVFLSHVLGMAESSTPPDPDKRKSLGVSQSSNPTSLLKRMLPLLRLSRRPGSLPETFLFPTPVLLSPNVKLVTKFL